MSLSLKQQLAKKPPHEQERALRLMAEKAGCSLDELATALMTDWAFNGRPEQQAPPGHWKIWLVMTGRRWGKTRTAAEWVHKRVNALPRSAGSTGGLLQRTSADLRDIMIEGPSGLKATEKPGFPIKYEPSKKKVTFHNGYVMNCYSAEEPDALRGPTLSTLWADEFASLKTVTGVDGLTAFDNALFALSAPVPGDRPRGIITTTPRRVKSVKRMLAEAAQRPADFAVTSGSLMDNIDNLDPTSVQELLTKYAGTSLGSQELDGILTTDLEGAPFKSSVFNATRIEDPADVPELAKTVIAVDPSTGDGTADECGISVVGISAAAIPTEFEHRGLIVVRNLKHIYVLEDASISGPPDVWAARVAAKADEYETMTVVAEGNQGGQMVKTTIRSANPRLRVKVVNARVGKEARAEPVAALFAQGRAHIVGEQAEMEDQATTHVAGAKDSPDRMDAMVWGVTFLEPQATRQVATATVDPAVFAQHVGSPAVQATRRTSIGSPDSGSYLTRRIG